MKINKKRLILTTIVCLLPIAVGVFLYPQLPERIATHWGFDNEPNGWSSKAFAVFGLPALMAGFNLVLPLALATDPKRKNMNPALLRICFWIVPIVSVLCSAMTLLYAMGYPVNVAQLTPAFVGVVFIVIGNYLPKTKQSYTMGIKLPWTLNSEENWNRTHRLGGFLWVLGGVVFLALSFLQCWNIYVFIAVLSVLLLVPTVYSYLLYRKGI